MGNTAEVPETKVEPKTFGDAYFSPGMYTLDLSAAKDMRVMLNGYPSTFGDVYRKLRDSKILHMPDFFCGASKYSTDSGDVDVYADWPVLFTLHKLIDLTRQGINPHNIMWFYYDRD